jgi:hypothetical protein
MARSWTRFQSPGIYIGVWWLVGFVVTAVVFGLGDFGIPGWIAPFCILWVFTAGLPTALAFIVATGLNGVLVTFFGELPFVLFVIFVAAVSLAAHGAAFFLLVRWKKNWRTR